VTVPVHLEVASAAGIERLAPRWTTRRRSSTTDATTATTARELAVLPERPYRRRANLLETLDRSGIAALLFSSYPMHEGAPMKSASSITQSHEVELEATRRFLLTLHPATDVETFSVLCAMYPAPGCNQN
jgi:hypothetical protein